MKKQNAHGVLILTEAGTDIGYGHFTRCSAIQQHLNQKNIPCTMLLDFRGDGTNLAYTDVMVIDWYHDRGVLKDFGKRFDRVLVDSYLASETLFADIRTLFKYVVAIDDYNRMIYPADLVLNLNVFFEDMDYSRQKVPTQGGKEYVILRPSFIENRKKYKVKEQIHRILITIGGSDYRKLVPEFIGSLANTSFELKVVAGNNSYRNELSQYMGHHQIYGYVKEDILASLMLNSDIVISGAGQTLHELACLGVPTIAICVGHDQQLNINNYVKNGFLLEPLYWDNSNLLGKINQLLSHMQEPSIRQKLSDNGKTIIDGNGIIRICSLLEHPP